MSSPHWSVPIAETSATISVSIVASDTLSRTVLSALKALHAAAQYAAQCRVDLWEFAVDLAALRRLRLTDNDLRWMILAGLVEHREARTSERMVRRDFQPVEPTTLNRRSCFVLTEFGRHAVECELRMRRSRRYACELTDQIVRGPRWIPATRQLLFDGRLIRQFAAQAQNQLRILAAFEEEGWLGHIDDPLPPVAELDCKQRLHDTIKRLNRHHVHRALHFFGNGTGQAIGWSPVL